MDFKLIVESGSTKTDWVLVNKHQELKFETKGINPSANEAMFDLALASPELISHGIKIKAVHYFGAGIINDHTRTIIRNWLSQYFKNVSIWQIESDMLGAAHSTAGNHAGIVCILGTGSNSCVFDGTKITANIPALGFALSNEGGGSKIGGNLLKAFFYNQLPEDVETEFRSRFQLDKSSVVQALYLGENPTAYLAGFASFLNETPNKTWRKEFLFPIFQEFIDIRIKQYPQYSTYEIYFVGSIAYFYTDILKEVLQKNNLNCTSIIRKPIDGLVQFFK